MSSTSTHGNLVSERPWSAARTPATRQVSIRPASSPAGGRRAVALLGHARERERAVEEGGVRRDHDAVGGHAPARRLDGAALVGVDLDGVGVLVDLVQRLGEGQPGTCRTLELRLVVEAVAPA
jgi:hypothetical protein